MIGQLTWEQLLDVAAVALPPKPAPVVPIAFEPFLEDLGVSNRFGRAFVRVGASPERGQYVVTPDGLYSFAAADAGRELEVNFAWGAAPVIKVNTQLMHVPSPPGAPLWMARPPISLAQAQMVLPKDLAENMERQWRTLYGVNRMPVDVAIGHIPWKFP